MKLKSLLFSCAMTLSCFATFALSSNPVLSNNSLSANLPGSFTGLSWELVASDAIPGFDTYRVYANFTNPGDQLTAVFGQDVTPLTISTTGTFYQDVNGGALSSDVNPAFFGAFPDLQYDSWVTIGADAGASALSSLGVDYSSFESGSTLSIADPIGGAWFVLPDSEPAAFPDGSGRVLIAQLTTDGFVSMTVNVQYRAVDTTNPQEVGLLLNFPPVVNGCTNPAACNFNPAANVDDGSCNLPDGCTNSAACNYNSAALCDDGSCILPDGCTNPTACNYNSTALCDDGSCILPDGCTNSAACNYNSAAVCDDGSCSTVVGCTNPIACNFNSSAACDDGSCILPQWYLPNTLNAGPIVYACSAPVNYYLADQACAQTVVSNDPYCVNTNWDIICMTAYNCCLGNFGCNDPVACNYDPLLCEDNTLCILPQWYLPNTLNAGPIVYACSAPVNYYLADQACAQTVVSNDPYCVNTNWDIVCMTAYNCCLGNFGCNDPVACNYDPELCEDNNLCTYPGCMNNTACNYNASAACDDGSCILPDGCTNAAACNYNSAALCDDGSCILPDGCTNPTACNYNSTALCDDGSCILPDGCTNSAACNYNSAAVCDDGSCILPDGCTNPVACNYNSAALCDDGSCIFQQFYLPNTLNAGPIVVACSAPANYYLADQDCALTVFYNDPFCINTNWDEVCMAAYNCCLDNYGCNDPGACNYDPLLCEDNTLCILPDGCTNSAACNYNSAALCDDGSCILPDGCINSEACNYNSTALCDDGSCEFLSCLPGCTYPLADNYNASVPSDDGSCIFSGCTNSAASNYSPIANNDDGSCVIDVLGCTYASANNYNAAATVDDGNCDFPVVSGTCPADLNGDDIINTGDLNALLSVYGTTCP